MLDPKDQQENREQRDRTELQDLVDKLGWQVCRVPPACWVHQDLPAPREPQDWMDRKDSWEMVGSQG